MQLSPGWLEKGAYIGTNRYFVTINVRERQPRFTDGQLVETCRESKLVCCVQIERIPGHSGLLYAGSLTFAAGGSGRRIGFLSVHERREAAHFVSCDSTGVEVGSGRMDITIASCGRTRIWRHMSTTSCKTRFAPDLWNGPRTTRTAYESVSRECNPAGDSGSPHSAPKQSLDQRAPRGGRGASCQRSRRPPVVRVRRQTPPDHVDRIRTAAVDEAGEHHAAATPVSPPPMTAAIMPASTSRITSPVPAPSAIRTPISCVRWATTNVTRP